jgi:hypothetical protein
VRYKVTSGGYSRRRLGVVDYFPQSGSKNLTTGFAVSTRLPLLTIQNILGVVKCYSVLFGKKEVIREYRMIYRSIEDKAFSPSYDLAPPPSPLPLSRL